MATVAVSSGPVQDVPNAPVQNEQEFDFAKAMGEADGCESAEESPADSTFGEETESLLNDMRNAITEQGLVGSAYKAPDLLRFMRARNNNIKKASKLFVDHENWRATFCPRGFIYEEDVINELNAKKAVLGGKDKLGQPLSISLVKNHEASKRELEEFKRFIVHALDKVVASMPPGVEKFVGLLDLSNIGYSNLDSAALRHIFDFLQGYYPERLGKLFFLNAPFIFGAVWKVVSPFIDSRTRKKIVFCTSKNLPQVFMSHFEPHQVPAEFGGTGTLTYFQDVYVAGYPPDEAKKAKSANDSASSTPVPATHSSA